MKRIALSSMLVVLFAGLAAAQPTLDDADLPFVDKNGTQVPVFMHSKTFEGASQSWGARDEVEIEAARTMNCIPGPELYDLLESDDRRNFRRLRRSPAMEAFTTGFNLDEIPWGGDSHDVREGIIPWNDDAEPLPTHVWLSIESDRFSVDPERGRRRLNMGTDIMDDIYYDTDDFLLLRNGMSIRARKRWDTTTTMRRLLIALKLERGVDEFGIKRAAKMDVRRDSPSDDAIATLHEAVPMGNDSWSNNPAAPLRRAYEILKARGVLESSQSYEHVLVLKPQVFIRSVRSRFHLNETPLDDVKKLYELGRTRLEAIAAMAAEARMDGVIPTARMDEVEAFEQKVRDVLSGDLVAERAFDALAALGFDAPDGAAIASLLPGSDGPGSSTDVADVTARKNIVEQRRVVANTINALYHELAEDLDDGTGESLRRVISRSLDQSLEDHADWFTEFKMSGDASLRRLRTANRFVELHAEAMADPAILAAYNAFGVARRDGGDAAVLATLNVPTLTAADLAARGGITEARAQIILDGRAALTDATFTDMSQVSDLSGIGQVTMDALESAFGKRDRDFRRFATVDADEFGDVRFQLRNEQVRTWMRQIEEAGSSADGLWFDEAREFYVPRSSRSWGNFLIDTMDFAAMYSADVWGDMPPAERNAAVDLSQPPYADKLLHATVVNEVQIELTSGSAYTDRLRELKALTALPRAFMLWAESTGQASTPDEHKALFEQLKALGNTELDAKVAELNAFIDSSDAVDLDRIESSEFRDWISPERLTVEVRDDPDYSEEAIETAKAGATFVFDQYRDMLNQINNLKEDRVRRTLRRAGAPNCMEWLPTEGSKGSIAMGILKRRADAANANAANGGGLVGALDNSTAAGAEAVEAGLVYSDSIDDDTSDYYKLEVKAGETVVINLNFAVADGDLELAIQDAQGAQLAVSETHTDNESLTYTATADETITIEVYGWDGGTNSYDLEILD